MVDHYHRALEPFYNKLHLPIESVPCVLPGWRYSKAIVRLVGMPPLGSFGLVGIRPLVDDRQKRAGTAWGSPWLARTIGGKNKWYKCYQGNRCEKGQSLRSMGEGKSFSRKHNLAVGTMGICPCFLLLSEAFEYLWKYYNCGPVFWLCIFWPHS